MCLTHWSGVWPLRARCVRHSAWRAWSLSRLPPSAGPRAPPALPWIRTRRAYACVYAYSGRVRSASRLAAYVRTWEPPPPCTHFLVRVRPRKPEGNRTRRWRMAGTPDQRMPTVDQLVNVADGHAGSGSVSSRAQRRRASDVTCSIRYRNWLVHRPAAPSARALESVCSALTLEKNLRLTCVSHW